MSTFVQLCEIFRHETCVRDSHVIEHAIIDECYIEEGIYAISSHFLCLGSEGWVRACTWDAYLFLFWYQGVDLTVKELDSLMHLLSEKKRKAEQEEAETNMEILLEFLHRSRQQKQEELNLVRL
jgi:hypothetical protein